MRICLVALMALVLSACGSKTEQAAATKKPAAAVSMPTFGSDDAVAAVLESQGAPVAQLRFAIESRPVAGKPFRLQLVASATTAVPQLLLTTEADGLAIDPLKAVLALNDSGGGAGHQYSASQEFSVTAPQEGLTELTVHLTADADAPETLYVIPVLVAKAGSPDSAPASDKPDPAAAGNHRDPKKG